MADLTVTLKLDRDKCLEHESVWFEAEIKNTSGEPQENLPALDKKNLAVRLVLESSNGRRTAHQFSARSRDGGSYHEPDRPKTVTLQPGQAIALSGDLLDYFGGMRAGAYKVSAVYEPALGEISSQPVTLHVAKAKAVAAATPHQCQGMPDAPIANAWVHEDGDGRVLVYQEGSILLPPNPQHGYRIPGPFQAKRLYVAQLPYDDVPSGHLAWVSDTGSLQLAVVDRTKHTVPPPREVKLPFAGEPMDSPESMQDGSVWIPFTDNKRERFAALQVRTDGSVRVEELRVGSLTPIASRVNLWDYDANLFFAWAAEGKSEVRCGVLSLTEPDSRFKPLLAHSFDSPVVWLDGYVDLGAEDDRDAILWCVRRKAAAFVCCKFRIATATWVTEAMLPADGLPELRPCASVVGFDRRLGVLFAAPNGELWYGSTKDAKITPVRDAGGKAIHKSQSPGLLAAGSDSVLPWIYLRYITGEASLAMLKLEPAKEDDPATSWKL
jgi:hypothetical protein